MQHMNRAIQEIKDAALEWCPREEIEEILGGSIEAAIVTESVQQLRREFDRYQSPDQSRIPFPCDTQRVNDVEHEWDTAITALQKLVSTRIRQCVDAALRREVLRVYESAISNEKGREPEPPSNSMTDAVELRVFTQAEPGPATGQSQNGASLANARAEDQTGSDTMPKQVDNLVEMPRFGSSAEKDPSNSGDGNDTDQRVTYRISVPSTGDLMCAVRLIDEVRRIKEFRILRLAGQHMDGFTIWISPRDDVEVAGRLETLPEVSSVRLEESQDQLEVKLSITLQDQLQEQLA